MFSLSSGTTSVSIPSPKDWDLSAPRPMEVARTLSSAVVSAWPKIVAGRQITYEQRLSESEYVALAALDNHASTTVWTLCADAAVYTVTIDIQKATRVYQNGRPCRDVTMMITMVTQVA